MLFEFLVIAFVLLSQALGDKHNSTYHNPILPGFHPDPSCIFVPDLDDTFFCASSSFLVFPGVPIHASRDLRTWKLISNALSRAEQLPILSTVKRATSGIWAPTLRYRKGKFYLVTTLVFDDFPKNSTTRFDNFVITTRNPYRADAWSQPVHFNFTGYDTSPFWDDEDDDDNVAITGTHAWEVSPGIQKIDVNLRTGAVGKEVNIWNGTGESAPEGPHIYRRDGYYYVLIAEGGTGHGHRVTMGRSKDIDGPYEGHPRNPVLTNVNTTSYFQNVGHADLFQDRRGKWWAVALAVREGPDGSYPMGRETVLTPVTGEAEGWHLDNLGPVQRGEGGLVDASPVHLAFKAGSKLPPEFVYWRIPKEGNYRTTTRGLELVSSSANLTGADGRSAEPKGQTFIARRQVHSLFTFSATFDISSLRTHGQEVGVSVFLDQLHHYDLGIAILNGTAQFRLRGITTVPTFISNDIALVPFPITWLGRLVFEIRAANITHYTFLVGPVGRPAEARVIGYAPGLGLTWGFTGALLGVYATTNGEAEEFNTCVSDWKYIGAKQAIE
ncbi:glycoside hydrolase family 43 protein [Bisporella sp. PMI_857]|nr:glycoside hydrolase family 43 protein [Bisporella sp. PMI_857]